MLPSPCACSHSTIRTLTHCLLRAAAMRALPSSRRPRIRPYLSRRSTCASTIMCALISNHVCVPADFEATNVSVSRGSHLPQARLQSPAVQTFVVVDAVDPNIVMGSFSLLDMQSAHRSLEIGAVWIGAAFRGSARSKFANVAAAAVYLCLQHAFDTLGCYRVWWKCDSRNEASKKTVRSSSSRLRIRRLIVCFTRSVCRYFAFPRHSRPRSRARNSRACCVAI